MSGVESGAGPEWTREADRYGVAAATVLALAVFAVMLGSGLAAPVLVLALAQVAVYLAATRRRAPSAALRIPVLWSVQAGLTWAVAGGPGVVSAAVFVAVGAVFAVLGHLLLLWVGRAADHDVADTTGEPADRRTDTAPLPIVED